MLAITNPVETTYGDRADTMSLGPGAGVDRQDVAIGQRRFIIPSRSPQEQELLSPGRSNGTTEGRSAFEPTTVLRIPPAPVVTQHFTMLQQWEGTVTKVTPEEFFALLRDLTQSARPEEQASFPVEEVPDADHSLVVPGAVFYWTIGYEVTITGTRKTVSMLRFRRLPAWSQSELRRIKADAERFQKLLAPNS